MTSPRTHDSVAVASGTFSTIERWGELLRKNKIRFEVRWFCEDDAARDCRYAELWVTEDMVDAARAIIRATGPKESLLW